MTAGQTREDVQQEIRQCLSVIARNKARVTELRKSLSAFDGDWPKIARPLPAWRSWGPKYYLVHGFEVSRWSDRKTYITQGIKNDGTPKQQSRGCAIEDDGNEPEFLSDAEERALAEQFPTRAWAKAIMARTAAAS